MGYKVVSRIKDEESDSGYLERGETVKKSDFEEKDWEDMLAGGSIVTDREFNALFPNYGDDEADEAEDDEEQKPAPTPSSGGGSPQPTTPSTPPTGGQQGSGQSGSSS